MRTLLLISSIFLLMFVYSCEKSEDLNQTSFADGRIIVPKSFEPNNDGKQDTFFVTAPNLYSYQLKIFNSRNLIVFESVNQYRGWNGNYLGEPVPAGTYTWILNFRIEPTDAEQIVSGSLELIR